MMKTMLGLSAANAVLAVIAEQAMATAIRGYHCNFFISSSGNMARRSYP